MKYFILLSGILYSGLHGADAKPNLMKELEKALQLKHTIATFYDAVRADDAESIIKHLQSKKVYPLNNLAKEATKRQHPQALSLLLSEGALPPLYEAATQGRRDLALLTLKYLTHIAEPLTPQEKERILRRLTKTGKTQIFHMYFDFGVLRPEDVSHSIVEEAKKRQSPVYKDLIDKRFMHGTGTCAICITDFTEEEVRKPELLLKCGHMFHEPCRDEWFARRPTCPLCKKLVRKKKK